MSTLPLHPAIVHLPLGLTFVLPLLGAVALAAWLKGSVPARAWWGVVLLQSVLVVSAFVSMKLGEEDEERVERVVAEAARFEAAVETHEELAEAFTWGSAGVLVLMVAAGVLGARKVGPGLAGVAVLGSVVTAGLGVAVGHAGGELVYTHGAAAAYVAGAPAAGAVAGSDEDDDD